MKNAASLFGIITFIAIIGFIITGCTEEPDTIDPDITLDRIEITNQPAKTDYFIGDTLSLDGLVVTAVYSDDSKETVNLTIAIISGFDSSSAGEKNVTITWNGKTAVFTVTVTANNIVLTGIEITSATAKKIYNIGDMLDLAGLVVTAKYDNGDTEIIVHSSLQISYDFSAAGEKTVTITFNGRTASFAVTVNTVDVSLTNIVITSEPLKKIYNVGDILDLAGLVVTANYNNGNTEIIVHSSLQISYDFSTTGEKTIAVTFNGRTASFTVTVNTVDVSLTNIVITTEPLKKIYNVDDTLDLTGLVVTANYSNGDAAIIVHSSLQISYDFSTAGEKTVTITFNGRTASFTVTVNTVDVSLTNIVITSEPLKKIYNVDDTLDLAGLVVTANYNNGDAIIIEHSSLQISYDFSTAGEKTVTVTFGGKSDTFAVTVNENVISVTGVTLNRTILTLAAGDEETLNFTIQPETATNKNVSWKSSAESFVIVDNNGKVTAVSAGTATITITTDDGAKTETCVVTVIQPVTDITGVPVSAVVGTPLALIGTVTPGDATNQIIEWSVQSIGTTGASISDGNVLNTTAPGSVTLTAVITNGLVNGAFTKDFTITVMQPVSGITGIPVVAAAGIQLTLTGTVSPGNASYKTIIWSVQNAGTTGASITGSNMLNTTGAGTVIVNAAINDGLDIGTPYSEDFTITVIQQVTNITGIPSSAKEGVPLTLTGTVVPAGATNQTIEWSVQNAGTTGAAITDGNTLNTTGPGTAVITATIAGGLASGSYTQNFIIIVQKDEYFTVTITPDAAPVITGPTIHLNAANGLTTETITVDNPSQYSSINWFITGTSITGSGASFELNSSNIAYNRTGEYFLTVEVMRNGVPYSRTITFTVAE